MKVVNLKMQLLFIIIIASTFSNNIFANNLNHRPSRVKGVITSTEDKKPVAFATVFIKDTEIGCVTNDAGEFNMKTPSGTQTIGVSFLGYEPFFKEIDVTHGKISELNIEITPSAITLDEIVVKGESNSSKINKTAYNVQSLSMEALKNTSSNLTNALSRVGGVKIRETGGVGSDTNISLNGLSGNHVKIFIDGVQLDKNNSAFSLSNMPANFAERIDVYSGVVPIEFGTDAIGGVINIITNKDLRYRSFNLDASYSYGSFNTHSSFLNLGQVFENGLTYNFNIYQNYSDNDYWINTTVAKFTENPGWAPSPDYSDKTIYRVRRFNDAYHNETGIATIGVANKTWADILTFKLNYSQYDNEIQTGVVQDIVYGEKKRNGHSVTPTLDYSKEDIFTKGLDLRLSANYSNGYTRNYDPATHSYSWSGESVVNSSLTPVDNETKNRSYNANFVTKYTLLDNHTITLSNTFGSSSRITRSKEAGTSVYTVWDTPKRNIKNITGASYRYNFNEKLDITAFSKYYWQANEGVVLDGSDYKFMTQHNDSWGYGAATTYFIIKGLQTKLSYEKAFRLPTSTEIFGDNDLEVGTFSLKPETSYNYNFNVSYNTDFGKHNLFVDGGLIYRDTRDYIIRSVSSSNSFSSSASYENHGKVKTKGYTISARYSYGKLFSLGGTLNNLNARNAEKNLHGGTNYETLTYKLRLPNTPYLYANGDGTINFYDIFDKNDSFSVVYDLFYQHSFPLNWENIGYKDSKMTVPTQLAHNIMINYSLKGGKYNFSVEAKNITDAHLYDNYSLQKAGRAFYAKFRINIAKTRTK